MLEVLQYLNLIHPLFREEAKTMNIYSSQYSKHLHMPSSKFKCFIQ